MSYFLINRLLFQSIEKPRKPLYISTFQRVSGILPKVDYRGIEPIILCADNRVFTRFFAFVDKFGDKIFKCSTQRAYLSWDHCIINFHKISGVPVLKSTPQVKGENL